MAITIKHKKVSTILDTDDTSLVRPSDWNDTHDLTGTISVSNGGTGADNATDATNNLLPTQTGQSGKYLSTDGTNTQWLTVPSSGGGSSVSYYLNGGVSQGTFGGNTYYQMNKTPVTATPANFTIATNGYIAQFITDVNDPSLLNIPAGNWNFEMYFSASSGGGSPSFYVELYKYNGTTFTLISSGSTSPESITGGTVKDVYISALAVPATTLALTDRLAVRVYVNNSGRTITLYTQDNNLCQVITTFSTGITALNGLTAQVQTFATGTTGTDFNISSATSTHTFNLPTASASNRGALSSSDWSTFNDKANAFTYTTNYIPYGQGTTTPLQSANLQFNGTTLTANDITDSSLTAGRVTYAGTGGNLRDASNFTYDGTNLVAGAIQNTPIGATTPSTVNATTITGQTGRLNGTGNNLLLQSNAFTTAPWTTTSATIATTVATTDPFGGSNAWIITNDATLARHQVQQAFTSVSGITYTFSCYGKNNNAGFLYLRWASSNKTVVFNLSTGAVGTTDSGITASITNAGNGWYRCIATYTTAITSDTLAVGLAESDSISTYSGTSKSIYLYGSQLEVSSTANTYIPTTTTAVYGTPTLSFSGVSTIGLEQTGALYLQPAGTGAIQAQATTSTSAGGNARGANAVDWQTTRGSAAQVASAINSVLAGGQNNTSGSFASAILGGVGNTTAGSVGYQFVGGGLTNASGTGSTGWSAILGGDNNTAAGFYNIIGGGYLNSCTSGSAVTTQVGATTSGSTAVTLTGSNANIKVGQYITGTGISSRTYVAAISGTSLTLSQNAASNQASTTLSFFTPHGVVVGGGNNQATGAYSFIGGGGDAGTAGNRNVASGDWSAVVGGSVNTASGVQTFIGSGRNNTASATQANIIGGQFNTASAAYTNIVAGNSNTASGAYSSVFGSSRGTTRGISGYTVFPANGETPLTQAGSNQTALLQMSRETTDATATVLTSNTSAAGTTNQVILPNNSAYYFRGEIIAGVTGGGNTKGWFVEGVIKRGANAASTTMVGTATVTSNYANLGAATWAVTATADTTNGGLAITVTGQASTTIRWVAQIRTTEMTY